MSPTPYWIKPQRRRHLIPRRRRLPRHPPTPSYDGVRVKTRPRAASASQQSSFVPSFDNKINHNNDEEDDALSTPTTNCYHCRDDDSTRHHHHHALDRLRIVARLRRRSIRRGRPSKLTDDDNVPPRTMCRMVPFYAHGSQDEDEWRLLLASPRGMHHRLHVS